MNESPDILLSVRRLGKAFEPGRDVVADVDLDVRRGELLAVLGPSGCGKTTLLRLIAGFEQADRGVVELEGRTLVDGRRSLVAPERRGIGFVFQDFALFPHLTVAGNIAFGLRGFDVEARKRRLAEMLSLVEMEAYANRLPHELSGGQQQRAALARSLAPQPAVVLLDEPFSGLDAQLREATRIDVRTLLRKTGQTAVLVTHDQEEALSVADRVAVMRSGRIEQVATAERMYRRPRNAFVAQFLGRTNLLEAAADGTHAVTPIGRVAMDRAASGPVMLSLRPEDLDLSEPAGDRPQGVVTERVFRGHDITFGVRVQHLDLLVHTPAHCPFRTGDAVSVVARAPAVVLA